MSKKNSSVNLKKGFKDYPDLSKIFLSFEKKLNNLKLQNCLVAVSGGPDSLALAALSKAYSYHKKCNFHFALVDHNIRSNSDKEAQKVKQLLKKKKINLKIFLNKKKITKNIQAEARKIRYEILLKYCQKRKIKTMLTAHNLEDQVETFLIRLSRGSGLKGLSSMKLQTKINKKVSLFRPLLDVPKKYLIKIAKNTFGKFFKDPSNTNLKFLRTKVRNLKKPLENSGIKYEKVFKSIQNLSSSRVTLDNYLKNIFNESISNTKKEVMIDLKKFKKFNNDVKIAIINESIKKLKNNYYDLRSKKVENLIENLSRKDFKRSTLGGCIFYKKNDKLCLKAEKLLN